MLPLSLAVNALMITGTVALVGLDIQKGAPADVLQPEKESLSQRQTVSTILDNNRNLYFANVSLGTPPQQLRLHLDTGSSDLWCNSLQSNLCGTRFQNCRVSGTYDSTASSTYKFVNHDFNISYVDGSGAVGDYVTDTFGIGGQKIPDLQFGVGIRSSSPEGVLGIGYPLNEVQVQRGHGKPYDNLLPRMVREGLIKTTAYSLWLNDLDASTGQILFGGVNTAKYHGSLRTIPILKAANQNVEILVALTGISLKGVNISSPTSLPAAVLLDSGSTLMYLPNDVTKSIYNQVNAVIDTSTGSVRPYAPCSLAQEDRSIDFTFSGIKISVPFNELILPSKTPDTFAPIFRDGSPACIFGIAPNDGGTSVLGDTFIRSAYVVYDLANNQVSLAQTNFNSTHDNVKEIQAGPSGVPDASLVPNPITRASGQINTGIARLAGAATTRTVISKASARAEVHLPGWLWLAAMVGFGWGA